MLALCAALLLAGIAEARPPKKISRDPRTVGLGRNCHQSKDCKHRLQRCVHESDAQGKPLAAGFCVGDRISGQQELLRARLAEGGQHSAEAPGAQTHGVAPRVRIR